MWDPSGRYFCVVGGKRSAFDKDLKSVRFYSLFGEPVKTIVDLKDLVSFSWRPRPSLLTPQEIEDLKKSYQKKYKKKFEEEEEKQQKAANEETQSKKREVRNQFLEEFFLPLRREFEKNIDEFEKLYPLKEENKEQIDYEVIYSFSKEISEKKINE